MYICGALFVIETSLSYVSGMLSVCAELRTIWDIKIMYVDLHLNGWAMYWKFLDLKSRRKKIVARFSSHHRISHHESQKGWFHIIYTPPEREALIYWFSWLRPLPKINSAMKLLLRCICVRVRLFSFGFRWASENSANWKCCIRDCCVWFEYECLIRVYTRTQTHSVAMGGKALRMCFHRYGYTISDSLFFFSPCFFPFCCSRSIVSFSTQEIKLIEWLQYLSDFFLSNNDNRENEMDSCKLCFAITKRQFTTHSI